MDWHPLRFAPLYQERVWGGRSMATLYGRALPGDRPIGESWELVDRPEAASVVAVGPLAGRTLGELLALDPRGLLGEASSRDGRFPLLVKILDARDVLSLQVHPPASRARQLGGESKTEMWFFTGVEPGATIMAGLRPGVTRAVFERRLAEGTVAECFHRLPVQAGDAMFLPSGRVHALGAGLVLFEIQENSDTTYRVFDWNRVGLDGRPRALHVAESLESIDFEDFEPGLVGRDPAVPVRAGSGIAVRTLVNDRLFRVEVFSGPAGATWSPSLRSCQILGLVRGRVEVRGGGVGMALHAGDFCLLPAGLRQVEVTCHGEAEWLSAEPGLAGDVAG